MTPAQSSAALASGHISFHRLPAYLHCLLAIVACTADPSHAQQTATHLPGAEEELPRGTHLLSEAPLLTHRTTVCPVLMPAVLWHIRKSRTVVDADVILPWLHLGIAKHALHSVQAGRCPVGGWQDMAAQEPEEPTKQLKPLAGTSSSASLAGS